MRELEISGIRKMFEMAGKDAINFGIGEPDFQPPDFVIEAYARAMREGKNNYGPSSGIPELRAAIAAHQQRFHGIELDPDGEVLVTTGATEAIAAALLALCESGDEVDATLDEQVADVQRDLDESFDEVERSFRAELDRRLPEQAAP